MGVLGSLLVAVVVAALLVSTGCPLRPWGKKERSQQPYSQAAGRSDEAGEQEPVIKKYVLKSEEGGVSMREAGREQPQETVGSKASDEALPAGAAPAVLGEAQEETPQARAERMRTAGMGYFNRQMYDDAIRYFSDAIELSPSVPEPYYYRAKSRLLLPTGEQDVQAMLLALDDLDAALERDGNYYDALVERARLKVEIAHLNRDADLMVEGIHDYTAALELRGESAEVLCSRGVAKEYLGELKDEPVVLEQAVVDITRGLELDPEDGEGYLQRGYILGELYERFDYAVEYLAEAVQDFRRSCTLGLKDGCDYAAAAEELFKTVSAGLPTEREEVALASPEPSPQAAESAVEEVAPVVAAGEEPAEGEHRVFMVIAESTGMAEEIRQLLDGGADVESVASRYRANSEITTVKLSELKEVFQQHLRGLQVGQSTPIIEDGGYYYIIYLLE